MKKVFLVVLMHYCYFITNAQFTDNFSDGDFTNNPAWSGTDTKFIVNGDFKLQSNGDDTAADELFLSTPSTLINNTEWIFNLNLLFNPTATTNYAKIFITSDQADLSGDLNGYFLRIGETGTSDTLELWRKDGATETRILVGSVAYGSTMDATVKVERDNNGNWNLFSDPNGGTAFVFEGTTFDNTHTSTSFFGVYCRYSTISRYNMFLFDDFVVQNIVPDTDPPVLSSVFATSNNQLEVTFNEAISSATAQNISNYLVNGGIGVPSTAILQANSQTVQLTFGNNFINGNNYNITVSNIDDLAGNTLTSANENFTFFTPSFRDVIFSEIHPINSDDTDLPNAEFVELYNRSDFDINLLNFQYTDASSTVATFTNFVLPSKSYVTVCRNSDTSLFSSFGSVLGISSWPTLNNAGDDLVLFDASGNVMDNVNYRDSWYRGASSSGVSLEIINPEHPCSLSLNWAASTNSSGGTPSQQNSVYDTTPDQIAPEIETYTLLGDTALLIIFNEPLDTSTVIINNFNIDINEISNVIVGETSSEVILFFNTPITPNIIHEVQIENLSDCIGNSVEGIRFSFGIGISPVEYAVIINEIFADESPQVGLPNAEFAELYNPTNDIINLDGCQFTDFSGTMVLSEINMLPKSYLILSKSEDFFNYGDAFIASSMPGLNNAGEQLALIDTNGNIIHAVTYSDSWYGDNDKKSGGWSLEMVDPTNPCGEDNNWRASVDPSGGTPGRVNSINASNPDLTAPEIERAVATSPSSVHIYFNEKMDVGTIQKSSFSINKQQEIGSVSVSQDEKSVEIILNTTLEAREIYTVTVNGVSDCVGNIINNNFNFIDFALPEKPEIGDIIINEVLFNTYSGGDDFVEYYNTSNKYIDMKDVFILEYDGDGLKNIKTITSDYYVVAPNSYVWVTEEVEAVSLFYPKTVISNVIETDLPTYANASGIVAIGFYNDDSLVIADRFDYIDKYHYELLDDEKGVSLERVSFEGETNNPNNWHSASSTENFATPGYENSQQKNVIDLEDNITIDPLVFTPDNDGDKDFTTINYNFEEIGYTLNITIFDSYGRLIENLVRNELVGRQGFFQWDGIDNQNQKAGVGYYILLIEVFDLNGNTSAFKKKVVVGARF